MAAQKTSSIGGEGAGGMEITTKKKDKKDSMFSFENSLEFFSFEKKKKGGKKKGKKEREKKLSGLLFKTSVAPYFQEEEPLIKEDTSVKTPFA